MNRFIGLALSLLISGMSGMMAQEPITNHQLTTTWGEQIDKQNVWNEYPRPVLERKNWMNLNGEWSYAITPIGSPSPSTFDGRILVPFCVESSLSGVGKTLDGKHELWYNREFTVPAGWKGQNIILHFGAVDWKADVWVNGIQVGSHTGGYTSFHFDVTAALNPKGKNTLTICVTDGTDKGWQPRGKQVSTPEGIWYTAVSGIWQTVWMEPVPALHIEQVKAVPDIDANTLTVDVPLSETTSRENAVIEIKVMDNGKVVAQGKSLRDEPIRIHMPQDTKLWSPDSPFLYDLEVTVSMGGRAIDCAKSYTAMRKVGTRRDKDGIVRFTLNNKDIFHFGPLDQGWWPDGLYTAPSYEALIYDIDKTKEWGFNMIRKHIKVEPQLWYTYCDRKGIIVWQDMPSGDKNPEWQMHSYFNGVERVRSQESEDNYRKEWTEIMEQLCVHPCINVWIPFNEAWGQFKTPEITEFTKKLDPTRLVNPASGGNFYTCGDILDLHNYPGPAMYLFDAQRANVLGEYGGIGYAVKDHLWFKNRNWGYVQFNSSEEVTSEYVKYAEQLYQFALKGFTGAVYTQTTDVEGEVNGFMTYDRKIIKMDEQRIRAINQKLVHCLDK